MTASREARAVGEGVSGRPEEEEIAMLGLLLRVLLAAGGGAAALLVGRDAPNFPVVQGMLALVVAVLVFVVLGLVGRR